MRLPSSPVEDFSRPALAEDLAIDRAIDRDSLVMRDALEAARGRFRSQVDYAIGE